MALVATGPTKAVATPTTETASVQGNEHHQGTEDEFQTSHKADFLHFS